MKFVYPEFLWGLTAISIPIIIHLFHFRRYKTLYFSSLKFLQYLDQQQKSVRKLKHWIILVLRMLAIVFLVFAFAQPYKPVDESLNKMGNPFLSIYIDNSFSMSAKGTEGELLSEAREKARKMLKDLPLETRVLLHTNLMNGIESRLISKVEAIELLDKIKLTPIRKSIDEVIEWERNIVKNEEARQKKLGAKQYILFSDFQKNQTRFDQLTRDKDGYYYPIQLKPQQASNIAVDSVWFTSPVRKLGENTELNIRLINYGDIVLNSIDVSCSINSIKRDFVIDLPPNKKTTTTINFTDNSSGYKVGKISVNDKQLFWDDDFYFSYFLDDHTNVLIVNGPDATDAVNKVYSLEKYYKLNVVELGSFSKDQLNQTDLVVLNGVNEISSGHGVILQEFVQGGGALGLFPGATIDKASWNSFLNQVQLPSFGATISSGTKIKTLAFDDPFFSGMFEKKSTNITLPAVSQLYQTQRSSSTRSFDLINLQNGLPLFMRSSTGGSIFLFTSSLASSFSTFTSDALFPSILLRMAEMSQRKTPIYMIIGKESSFPLIKKVKSESPVHIKNKEIDFIPKTEQSGLITYFILRGSESIEILKAGTFDIVDGDKIGTVSLNYSREESEVLLSSEKEIIDGMKDKGLEQVSFKKINEGQSLSKIELDKPVEYWRWMLIIALIFLLSEWAVLKYWK
ncbi:MAG: BatA domain-containing protein [Bacteroidota bacterium]